VSWSHPGRCRNEAAFARLAGVAPIPAISEVAPGTSQLLIATLGKAGQLPEIAAQLYDGFHGPVRKPLRDGIDDGSLSDVGDPEIAARAFIGAVAAVGLRAIVVHGAVRVEEIMASLTPRFWGGRGRQRAARRGILTLS
jgi:hypothetical protein